MHIFKIRKNLDSTSYFCFGINVFNKKDIFGELPCLFAKNKKFNSLDFDRKTAEFVDYQFANVQLKKNKVNPHRVAFLATELYDTGGHTEWLKNIMSSIHDIFEIKLFFTNYNGSSLAAKSKLREIDNYSEICRIPRIVNSKKSLLRLLSNVNTFSPKVIFVFMHRNDFYANALLYLLKKYTDTRIIYCNHCSHKPVLGCLFSDAFTSALPTTAYVDKKFRGINNSIPLNLCDSFKENIADITEKEKAEVRRELEISDEQYFTLTGCASYKLFDGDNSPYFEMIKHLLESEAKLVHVVITNLDQSQQKIVDGVFGNSSVRNRLKIIKLTKKYSRYFQACDLFIDSFPMASALTHIELMKHKKVSVVKINSDNALLSFHEYFPKNYPYMSDKAEDLERFVLDLLHNPEKINSMSEVLYLHYLNTFEARIIRDQCVDIVNNSDCLEKLFINLDENLHYNLDIE